LADEAALLVAGRSEGGEERATRAVHLLRQLVPLAFAASGARRLDDAKAPIGSLPAPETLHPALVVVGLVAAASSFLRQLFFSSLQSSS
jgi:hypothetical protein